MFSGLPCFFTFFTSTSGPVSSRPGSPLSWGCLPLCSPALASAAGSPAASVSYHAETISSRRRNIRQQRDGVNCKRYLIEVTDNSTRFKGSINAVLRMSFMLFLGSFSPKRVQKQQKYFNQSACSSHRGIFTTAAGPDINFIHFISLSAPLL